jgi:ferritin-like metal-binding protein YciE
LLFVWQFLQYFPELNLFRKSRMPKLNTLQDIYIDELRDIYNAEMQITKALPRMIKAVTNEELKSALENHLAETEGQIERLEQVFEMAGQKVRGKKCAAMEGIIEEGKEILSEDIDDNALDAMIIAAAQKVEHYEIASYGTVRTWANQLGFTDQAELLEQTLEEEKAANDLLTQIAEGMVNEMAEAGDSATEVSRNGFAGKNKRK